MRALFILIFAFGILILSPLEGSVEAQRAPRIEAFELRGALKPKAARPSLVRALPSLPRCFEDAKAKPAGAFGARLLIVSDGSVLAGEIDSTSIGDRAIERCLLDRLRAIRFPSVAEFEESHLMVKIAFGGSKGEERRSSAGPGDPRFDDEERANPPRPESSDERDVALSLHLREGKLSETERALIESRLDRVARLCQRREDEGAQRGGRISLRLSIDQSGTIVKLEAVYSNASQSLERCLLERVSKLIFPEARVELDAQLLFVDFDRERRRAPSR